MKLPSNSHLRLLSTLLAFCLAVASTNVDEADAERALKLATQGTEGRRQLNRKVLEEDVVSGLLRGQLGLFTNADGKVVADDSLNDSSNHASRRKKITRAVVHMGPPKTGTTAIQVGPSRYSRTKEGSFQYSKAFTGY